MKILFAPSDLGGGLGHISRCNALAAFAEKSGHQTVFLLQNPHLARQVQKKNRVVLAPGPHSQPTWLNKQIYKLLRSLKKEPLFVRISGLNYQVLRDGLVSADSIRSRISAYLNIIHQEQPDLIVGDTNLLIGIAARLAGKPVVQLVRQGFHPNHPNLIWWPHPGPEIQPPAVLGMFNTILQENGLPTISRIESLLEGDLNLIPSLPELDPVEDNLESDYIGPLLADSILTGQKYELELQRRPLIYITIGGGAGTVGSVKFFKTITSAFKNRDLNIIVSTTPKFYRKSLNRVAKNVQFAPWVQGRTVISQADLVIFHGGYGTMMETVDAGKPGIVIPFHSEQESNGRRLKATGSAELLHLSRQKETLVRREWNKMEYTYACKWNYDLKSEDLFNAADKILSDQSYKKAAASIQKKSQKYVGNQLFFDFVNSRLGVK